ncbi:MAG: mechanosensitive ion channel [Ruminococcaceae bacterium]|nr:mechanosensitive ion channel [Oscillospiraceae bacterium]
MENLINDLLSMIVPFAKNIVVALIVFVIGMKVANFIVKKIKRSKVYESMDKSASSFITSFISISLKTLVIVSVIAILGIPMSSVVALVASAGVAIGLAVQGALSNLVGGIMILFFKPFKVGDYVESQGVSGTVKEISVLYTKLLTVDNRAVTVPNGNLTNSIITNFSSEDLRRVDVEIFADYSNDIEKVKETMLAVAEKCPKALRDPAYAAVVLDCADSGIKYALRVWCNNADYWEVKFALTEGVRNAFKDSEINIPYNQLDVHIKQD